MFIKRLAGIGVAGFIIPLLMGWWLANSVDYAVASRGGEVLVSDGSGIRYVATNGNDSGDCSDAGNACLTVAYAVTQAVSGDLISIATGLYTQTAVVLTKSLTIATPVSSTPAILDGGGVDRLFLVEGGSHIVLQNLILQRGHGVQGGAVAVEQSTLTVTHVTFMSNTADFGGGLYAVNSHIILTESVWLGNEAMTITTDLAGQGGGIYGHSSYMQIVSNTIVNNNGRFEGGGLYLYDSRAHIAHNQVMGNTALREGGGLTAVYSQTAFLSPTMMLTLSNNHFGANAARFGGGIYVQQLVPTPTYSLVMRDNQFEGNAAEFGAGLYGEQIYLSMRRDQFRDNAADYGGALYLRALQGEVANATFAANIARQSGGGIRLYQTDMTFTNNEIRDNRSLIHGGGLYASLSQLQFMNNVIQHNVVTQTTKGWGGGLQLFSTDASLDGDRIIANEASIGGGLRLFGGNVSLSEVVVLENEASIGGGLTVESLAEVRLVNSVIAANEAAVWGAGLYVIDATTYLTHVTVAQNDGAAGVYVNDSTVTGANTLLDGHTVGLRNEGGDVTLLATLWSQNQQHIEGHITNLMGVTGTAALESDHIHLSAASDALDVGVITAVLMDIDGQQRPYHTGVDIGADERWATVAEKRVNRAVALPGESLQYTFLLTNATALSMSIVLTDTLPDEVSYGGGVTYTWGQADVVADQLRWSGILPAGSSAMLWLPVNVQPDAARGSVVSNTALVQDGTGSSETGAAVFTVANTRYVAINGVDGGNNCIDLANPCATIQWAVDQAADHDRIWVAAGQYAPVVVTRSLMLAGGYTNTFAMVDGQQYPTLIDGGNGARGLQVVGTVSVTVANMGFVNGFTGGAGGGIYAQDAQLWLHNLIMHDNAASEGSAVAVVNGWAQLVNVVAFDNAGGGTATAIAALDSRMQIYHATVVNNDGTAFMVNGGGALHITNTIVASHTVGVDNDGGGGVTMVATLWDNVATPTMGSVSQTGSITGAVALAADGYHLTGRSAALDAGVDTVVVEDVDGEERPFYRQPDIGADERYGIVAQLYVTPTSVPKRGRLTYELRLINNTNGAITVMVTGGTPTFVNMMVDMMTWQGEVAANDVMVVQWPGRVVATAPYGQVVTHSLPVADAFGPFMTNPATFRVWAGTFLPLFATSTAIYFK